MDPPPRPLLLVVEVVALSFWLGAAVLLAAVVAPALFAALPSRTSAGEVVGRVLPVLLWLGILVALIVGLIEVVARSGLLTKSAGFFIALACGYGLVLGQRIDRLRTSVGQPIETLSASDPRRVDFGRMHGLSVAALGVGMLAAAGLTVSAVRRLLGQRTTRRTFQQNFEPSHHA